MNQLLKHLTPPLILDGVRRMRDRLTVAAKSRDLERDYGGFSIRLPAGHMLPVYSKLYPRYDTFLPYLAAHLKPGQLVVDVGANCGDTLASLVARNSSLHYLCIEPDATFFTYLTSNVERIRARHPHSKIEVARRLVGKDVDRVALRGNASSKHAVPGSGETRSSTLDDIIVAYTKGSIALLKSDVDGYDYDVLRSGLVTLSKHKPLAFFECQYNTPEQKAGYERITDEMQRIGYCDWTLFDNFGELILRTDDLRILRQLISYVWRQTTNRSARTIHYFDILAGCGGHEQLLSDVLTGYCALEN